MISLNLADELVVQNDILSIDGSELLVEENPFFQKSGYQSPPLSAGLVEFVLLPECEAQLLEDTLGLVELELDLLTQRRGHKSSPRVLIAQAVAFEHVLGL